MNAVYVNTLEFSFLVNVKVFQCQGLSWLLSLGIMFTFNHSNLSVFDIKEAEVY